MFFRKHGKTMIFLHEMHRNGSSERKFERILWEIGNSKQCLKFHWIFKQLKKSKTTSEGVIIHLPE